MEEDDRATPSTVRDTYDHIASHFATTREYAWPEVESFIETTEPLAERTAPADSATRPLVGLDLGCGNCRHAELLAATDAVDRVLGLDISRNLLETGRERARTNEFSVALCQGDAATLPLATDAITVGIYVATLHHLPTRKLRRRSLDELGRVLRPDGRALVSVWSTAHDRFDSDAAAETGFDTTVEWTLPGGETVDRFYHIYLPPEFERDLERSALDLREWELSSGNCYAVVAGAQE
ncbi:class I SAM-dependent methyltransferase [Natrialba aegyptia]|uniref:Type 11 methyltransferase n=1 Tax=Natrialba aegyptia DSM 13077 TaxID=1227491 RepID=M0BH53_9EURY|nr:class I SAM-dependent methyltransferase [Natrialba aegyptia]ELZ08974.1 type 11 methyltransferase [Natrialba aegyptia DSM 13077]